MRPLGNLGGEVSSALRVWAIASAAATPLLSSFPHESQGNAHLVIAQAEEVKSNFVAGAFLVVLPQNPGLWGSEDGGFPSLGKGVLPEFSNSFRKLLGSSRLPGPSGFFGILRALFTLRR